MKIQCADKSPEKWQMLVEKLKNFGCNYSSLQIHREGFLVFLNGYHTKIDCDEVRMANQCLEHGVLMYSFSFRPRVISIQQHKSSASNMNFFWVLRI